MRFDLLLSGGQAQTPDALVDADVGIAEGRIAAIGKLDATGADRVVDCRGLTLIPGLIDSQVHFREPGLEHKEDLATGTRAALAGGVTSILEMPNTDPPTISQAALDDKLARAHGRAWCNYGFFVGASPENADSLAELERLPGTPGVKIFMGSSTGSLLVGDDQTLERVLRHGERPCPVHAEDEPRNTARKTLIGANPTVAEHPFLRDAESARLATERLIRLAERTRRPVHVLHVSTLDELPLIAGAKARGARVTAEVTPQHLFFAAPECYERLGSLAQMNPPIRTEEHRGALWRALGDGLFDVFGSDHAPHTLEEKSKPYPASPSGMPGVQTMLPVLATFVAQGRLPLAQLVRMTSVNPARLYGIAGKRGLAVGADADVAAIDLQAYRLFERSMVVSKCRWSPYEGERLTGYAVHVVLGGEMAMSDGEIVGEPRGARLRYDWKA